MYTLRRTLLAGRLGRSTVDVAGRRSTGTSTDGWVETKTSVESHCSSDLPGTSFPNPVLENGPLVSDAEGSVVVPSPVYNAVRCGN